MVSSTVEPEWDDDSRALVLAADYVERMTGSLGEWLPEATSDTIGDPMSYSGVRFVPSGPHTNWAAKAAKDAEDEYRKSLGENANLNGVYFTVERREI